MTPKTVGSLYKTLKKAPFFDIISIDIFLMPMTYDILNRFQKGQGWTEILRKAMAKVVTVQDASKTYICSGSFIRYKGHNYILTNKHCVESKNDFIIQRYQTDAFYNIGDSREFETIPMNLFGKL